ncbi:MAG: hypothetical protein GX621_02525, partial [Pirellulaceae bacterium]|nr:hypothetical protein [Pirellulaceae bacterium]
MGHVADTTYTVQMFVNGEVCDDFENYVIRNRDEIVLVYSENPVLALNTNYGPIVIELFGDDTPITAANFLTYVNDGDYIQSFIHRSVPNFVIQGGGFTTDTTYFTDTTQFHAIVTNPPIVNEPGISNTRGTLAMAKVGGNPNSATSQFFVNLANNSANLDSQNGGFTVFGHVLDMYTVDLIASLPIDTTNASPYSELPYSDAGDLVVFESIAGLGRITGYKFHDANINDQFDA